jgi:hypothetical protein
MFKLITWCALENLFGLDRDHNSVPCSLFCFVVCVYAGLPETVGASPAVNWRRCGRGGGRRGGRSRPRRQQRQSRTDSRTCFIYISFESLTVNGRVFNLLLERNGQIATRLRNSEKVEG